ncbi:oxygenase MpaB family protein [Saccharothrix variisporea]|uniref:Uncharacterized protein DUF2236 n=1 Tax=Saccharothrix variisporea TaxID=543527 RepID=A0A495X6P4_9PSEU|nr:oxygenase MpaB family protein [Saccharothrix variisporea]RKT67168.1 uncharacterized protein DUF2236 [Saccharothrix variisporea]
MVRRTPDPLEDAVAPSYPELRKILKPMGDPLADAVVADILDSGAVDDVNQLFRRIVTVEDGVPPDAPPLLRDYLEETRQMPSWVDPRRVAGISTFFKRHKAVAATVQATAGLVGTYLSPVGAKTLHSTHALDRPHRRLSQSTRLFMGMGDEDAFTDHSKLIPTCQKVRLVHAAIRQLHLRSGRWDAEADGMPVSQYYTAGAALVFSAGTLDAMGRIGVKTTQAEQEGFFYAWKIVSHFLGVPDEYTPDSVSEAHALWDASRDQEWAHSEEGVLLTAASIRLYQEYLPAPVRPAVPAFLRRALSDKYADLVEVPKSAFDLGADLASSATSLLTSTPAAHNVVSDQVLGKLNEAVERVGRDAFTARHDTEPQLTDHVDDPVPAPRTEEKLKATPRSVH